jgi:hypothetical protein
MLFSTILSSPDAAPFIAMKKGKRMHEDFQLASDTAFEIDVATPAANIVE